MSGRTGIEWTERTWNPVVGCTKVSQGCKLCYAKTLHDMRHRAHLAGKKVAPQYARPFETVQLMPDRLDWPLGLQKASRIFVNSVSDLFHEDIPLTFIGAVFAVMGLASAHTFQVLTKRPARMIELLSSGAFQDELAMGVERIEERYIHWHGWDSHEQLIQALLSDDDAWPLPNVWLGVSVENQEAADERIPVLLQTPAAVRFLSCEPLLGPIDLTSAVIAPFSRFPDEPAVGSGPIDWVIVGGESGSSKQNPRPMHPNWARSIREQCVGAGVPFLFKQWGEYREYEPDPEQTGTLLVRTGTVDADIHAERAINPVWLDDRGNAFNDPDNLPIETPCRLLERVGKKRAGRLLDGRTWDQYPEARA